MWIGGNSPYGEYFHGLIDDVRVYNRALTQAEIQTDMEPRSVVAPAPMTPPSAPTNLVAQAVSATQVNLSWTAATDNVGVTGYRVERCQGSGCSSFAEVGTPTGTLFSNTGLSASTDYSYRVRARRCARGIWGVLVDRERDDPGGGDTTPPSAPTNLTATAVSTTSGQPVVDGRDGQRRRDGVPGGALSGLDVHDLRAGRDADRDLVQQHGVVGEHDVPVPRAGGRRGGQPGAVLVDRERDDSGGGRHDAADGADEPGGTAVSASQVNLSWTAATDNVGVTGYQVERCQGSACTTFAQVGTPTGTSFNNTGLSASTTYRYRVRAVDAAGNLGAYSSIVNATTPAAGDTTPPSAPTNLAGTAVRRARSTSRGRLRPTTSA